jgi:hypothetical protein
MVDCKILEKSGVKEKGDESILGSGEFVLDILEEDSPVQK